MSEDEQKSDHCIERRSILDTPHFYSVVEYDADMERAARLSSSKARGFHGVIWTEGAPEVQELTVEWRATKEGRFRICDSELYDAQMRQFLGLDPRPEDTYPGWSS